ncbi:uncharacterized protein ACR2FA_005294 [Aphomia sociella]
MVFTQAKAYLAEAAISPQKYDYWMCGGAIVSEWFIVTSAACVEDVTHLYAIAGYKKYVPTTKLNEDECTKQTKKKIVFTCVPKLYEFDYEKIDKWSHIDIAVVKVDTAFNFNDPVYTKFCSYAPNIIPINYEAKYQEPGVDAMVLGWGHLNKWRDQECKKQYSSIPELGPIIDKYMICTFESGNINAAGEQILKIKPTADGCMPDHGIVELETLHLLDIDESQIVENTPIPSEINDKETVDAGKTVLVCEDDSVLIADMRKAMFNTSVGYNVTRRQGICQNDHGGPLVTWVGSHEVLIGVASVFRVDLDSSCVGPYLFTSTQCNGAFLDCIINSEQQSPARRALCEKTPKERGFDMIQRRISWIGHPDGFLPDYCLATLCELPGIASLEIVCHGLKKTRPLYKSLCNLELSHKRPRFPALAAAAEKPAKCESNSRT